MTTPSEIASTVREVIAIALDELRAGHAAQGRAIAALEAALKTTLQGVFAPAPDIAASVSAHRRQHRPGAVPKIATDPELQVFIAARLDHMTYKQIEEAVAANFPQSRIAPRTAPLFRVKTMCHHPLQTM